MHVLQDTPVGTGYSYEEDGNIMRRGVPQTFSEAAADILELLRVLTGEIPTLQSSPLFLLHSTYGGTYAGKITNIVAKAILAAAPLIILRSEVLVIYII
jgi:serine carboxypeptidase 1